MSQPHRNGRRWPLPQVVIASLTGLVALVLLFPGQRDHDRSRGVLLSVRLPGAVRCRMEPRRRSGNGWGRRLVVLDSWTQDAPEVN